MNQNSVCCTLLRMAPVVVLLGQFVVCAPARAVEPPPAHLDMRQQDALNPDLQRGLRERQFDIAPDARKFEQMRLDRQLERQQHERELQLRDHALRRNAGSLSPQLLDERLELQRQLQAEERRRQIRNFELDRERQRGLQQVR